MFSILVVRLVVGGFVTDVDASIGVGRGTTSTTSTKSAGGLVGSRGSGFLLVDVVCCCKEKVCGVGEVLPFIGGDFFDKGLLTEV